MRSPVIAIASGKGGTGKTTVAVNLAVVCKEGVTLADCDVEEPNAHLFLRPRWEGAERFAVPYPSVDPERCDGRGRCGEVCRYGAIAVLGGRPLLFTELCHSCGGCLRACPIGEIPHEMGTVEWGRSGHVTFFHGRLDVGEARSSPLIHRVRKAANGKALTLIDAPPGTSCPVIAAVRGVDYLVLVTEPTPFGLSDLHLAVETARALELRHGVLINRSDLGDPSVLDYCRSRGILILGEIPFDRWVAEAYSRGRIASDVMPDQRSRFRRLLDRIRREAAR